mmetsp:Transcript_13712/g.20889  ORF Transcript_13712/g.20889 Transcript_13712/m.20889 type:complete len:85 (+) Transcript_13712:163-417(+)
MVCPYKAITGLVTATLSIIYLSSCCSGEEGKSVSSKKSNDSSSNLKTRSPIQRMLLITVLVIFHLDLFTTGYLRSSVKQLIAMM